MERYRHYLQKEIEIIRPHLIVAMGDRTHGILKDWLGSDARVTPSQHYSVRYANAVKRRRFTLTLTDIRREYERICGRRNGPKSR
jgi:uracil-DNA glycosylase